MAITFLGLTIGDDGKGFVIPTYAQWRGALAQSIRNLRGIANLNTDPGSLFGDFVDLVTQGVDLAAQAASDAVSNSKFTAMVGVALDQFLADILVRVQATPSTATVYAYGNAGSNIPIASAIRTQPQGVAWFTTGVVAIPAAPTVAYGLDLTNFPAGTYDGQIFTVTVDGVDASYPVANSDSGIEAKNGLIAAINALLQTQRAFDGGVNPTPPNRLTLLVVETQGGGDFPLVVASPGAPPALFAFPAIADPVTTAPVVGPTTANLGSLRLGPPIAGVTGYANILPAIPGRLRETDSQFKARHQITQRGLGGGSPDAVRANMLSPVSIGGGGLTYCAVEYNPDDTTDAVGNLPHSLRVVANADVNSIDLGNALWKAKAAGDDTNGDEKVVIQDAVGNNQELFYTLLSDSWIGVDITLSIGPDWPANGDPLTQLRDDVVNFIEGLQPTGNNYGVRVNELPISVYPNGTPRGVANFTVLLSTAGPNQDGPYTDNPNGAWPLPQPDAQAASVQLTSRVKARAKIAHVFAAIV